MTCWAADTASTPENKPSNQTTGLLQKKAWIDNIQSELPKLLCKKEHYFIQCYDITPKECDDFTEVLVRACLNSVSIALPDELTVEQGQHWGQMVSRCTYDLYEKFMQKKKKDLPACQIPTSTPADKSQPPLPASPANPAKAPS